MSVTSFVVIILVIVVASVIATKLSKQAKIENDQRRMKDEENRARMASLREKKEQKRQERLAREEQKRREKEELEEQRRLDEIKRIEEYKKQLAEQDRALNRLGLTEVEPDDENDEEEEYVEDYGYTSLEYQTNENLDIDKLFKYVSKYGLENESFKIWIHASSGNSMYFAFNEDVNVSFARIGESAVKKFQSKKALRNFVWCFCQNEQIIERNKRLATVLTVGIDSALNLRSPKTNLEDYLADILTKSDYGRLFEKQLSVYCEKEIALVEYNLPAKDDLSWVKEYKYVASSNTIKEVPMAESVISKDYEQLLYSICLRSIYELCLAKNTDSVKSVVFKRICDSHKPSEWHQRAKMYSFFAGV
jgi:restriction system protein